LKTGFKAEFLVILLTYGWNYSIIFDDLSL